jgi:hypothetical protein
MSLVKDLVAFVVSRINMERSAAINLNVAPKVLFTGTKSDFKKEFPLAFGDYCEVYDGMDNTSRERSVPCIALYPCNNAAGSWAFLNLKSKQWLRRTEWIKMVTNEEIIKQMNAYDVFRITRHRCRSGGACGTGGATIWRSRGQK